MGSTGTTMVSHDISELVTFWIGGCLFGVDICKVQEIDKVRQWTPVPQADPHVLGILSLRGSIVTIMDLAAKLGLCPTKLSHDSRIVIISADGRCAGFVADQIGPVMSMPSDQICPVPANVRPEQARFMEGIFQAQPHLVSILRAEAIIEDTKGQDTATEAGI
ncbi:MAG: chemotaxis protein CheW [Sedimentisphaerales bacterium]|nr:chemotaxis protein CheW [Sedimentisphaerales bacterium]